MQGTRGVCGVEDEMAVCGGGDELRDVLGSMVRERRDIGGRKGSGGHGQRRRRGSARSEEMRVSDGAAGGLHGSGVEQRRLGGGGGGGGGDRLGR